MAQPFIPGDLWTRLAWLDSYCDVQMARVPAPADPVSGGSADPDSAGMSWGAGWSAAAPPRVWRVTVIGRDRLDWPRIVVHAPNLIDAMRIAVLEAERRGWLVGLPSAGSTRPLTRPRETQPATPVEPQQ